MNLLLGGAFMWLQHCKIKCNLGILFIHRFPRCQQEPLCKVVFLPTNHLLPSIVLRLDEDSGKLSFESGWEKDSNIIELSDLDNLSRITVEALTWTENWHVFNGSTSYLYDSYLEKEIEAQDGDA